MILITGAGGKTGQMLVATLVERQEPVRALVRTSEQAGSSPADETTIGDLLDPAALEKAYQGVRAVYHICPNVHPQELEIGKQALQAAQTAGVQHFILHSVLHPQIQALPHHWNKLLVEEQLINSGLPFTVLQPASYMQNLLPEWWRVRLRSQYHVPFAVTAKFSMVDLADVAEAAAEVLASDRHIGAIYELAGPEVHTPKSTANEMGEALGKLVTAVEIKPTDWEGAPDLEPERRAMLLQMFEYYSEHGLWGNAQVLGELLGRPPTRLRDYLNRLVRESSEL